MPTDAFRPRNGRSCVLGTQDIKKSKKNVCPNDPGKIYYWRPQKIVVDGLGGARESLGGLKDSLCSLRRLSLRPQI